MWPIAGFFHPTAVIKPESHDALLVFLLKNLRWFSPCNINSILRHAAPDLPIVDQCLELWRQSNKTVRTLVAARLNCTRGTTRQHQ